MKNKFSIFNFQFSIPVKKGGFTVLESIVAIAILSLSISGVFAAIQQSLAQAIASKDEVKAYYLAQEAVEIIRNKRDTNQLNILNTGSGDWLEGISEEDLNLNDDPCYFGKVCRADAYDLSLNYCGNSWGTCPVLNQDPVTNLYNYTFGNPTKFTREIMLEEISPTEVAVIVRISWAGRFSPREFIIKTYLFNWI